MPPSTKRTLRPSLQTQLNCHDLLQAHCGQCAGRTDEHSGLSRLLTVAQACVGTVMVDVQHCITDDSHQGEDELC